ncbi:MAG: hypothetical protein H7832_00620 [Magnetococcus sp. DMHC-6]
MKVNKIWFPKNRLVFQLQPKMDENSEKRLRSLRREVMELLQQRRFISFAKVPKFLYDNQLNCLWLPHGFQAPAEEMFKYVAKLQIYAFKHWEIPTQEQVATLIKDNLLTNNEKFQNGTILTSTPVSGQPGFRTLTVGSDVEGVSNGIHYIIPMHRVGQRDILAFIIAHALIPRDVPGVTERLKALYDLTVELSKQNAEPPLPSMRALQQFFLEGDYVRARQPVLEPAYLYDMEKGLWEFYQPEPPKGEEWTEVTLEEPWEARNPELDLRQGVVAIDFGTSSTVVACREHGQTSLLRVGISDLFRAPEPTDYQNPTILSFIHLPNLIAAWNKEAYRPLTRWDDFHFSHEALSLYRENAVDQRVVASILTNIKQWPLKSGTEPLRITDQTTGTEIEVRHIKAQLPVKGQRITVSQEDPFDPIELYAYYLGLFINHRSNGLFLEYYMTFPVTYPREAKQRILSSFSRGLQRSLPDALLTSTHMNRFSVREEASEPAAYAACALEELDIEATAVGAAYSVFDFGGGSTDFDFGLFRLPSHDEEVKGYERVVKHFGASGDIYLGGENLVAQMVYLAFLQNLEICRQYKIPFSCPPESKRFPGHELFVDQSHVAQTNSTLLMAKVRPVWEAFDWLTEDGSDAVQASGAARRRSDVIGDAIGRVIINESFGVDPEVMSIAQADRWMELQVELLNRNREKVEVTFKVDRNQLNHYLVQRVGKGIHRFFIAMRQAFQSRQILPEEVHILQAGNSSRALLVQALFAAILQERMVKWTPAAQKSSSSPALRKIQESIPIPRFIVHRPPMGDINDPYKPNAKTGVAIGLLKLIPGETLLASGPLSENTQGEAPFRLYAGRLKNRRFQPILLQNGPYQEWTELGIPTRGAFILVYSFSPQAGLGTLERGDPELKEILINYGEIMEGKQLFIQAIGPTNVAICLAESLNQIQNKPEELSFYQTLELQ